jgi:phospholipase C
MQSSSYEFIISRTPNSDVYQTWRVDPAKDELLVAVKTRPDTTLDRECQLITVGNYLLAWGTQGSDPTPLNASPTGAPTPAYPYRLLQFDPKSPTPLSRNPVQSGWWDKAKFFWGRADFGHEGQDQGGYSDGTELCLISCGNFVLNFIPTQGRGTFRLWNFDPGLADPLPEYGPQGAFARIELGHQLIYISDYVIDWVPATGAYTLWSFDPLNKIPLSQPVIQTGTWKNIKAGHQLVRVGDKILHWNPADGSYRLLAFDPKATDPIAKVLKKGTLPKAITDGTTLTCVEPTIPVDAKQAASPGSMDFLRSKIKHVVYIMLENRSFDHICGWLYENDKPAQIIGGKGPFKGASTKLFNLNGKKEVHLSKFRDGKVDETQQLEIFHEDPYHDNSDVMRQLFYGSPETYLKQGKPNMGGFVANNGNENVMETFTPEQIPVLNGLAKNFAISDEWFCSMPGGTDVNRAFSLTGSSFNLLNNFQNGDEYIDWPFGLHRPSIFKVLWANGFTNWKIYNSVQWMNFVFTYHLFLQGQIPSLSPTATTEDPQNQDLPPNAPISPIDQFITDAKAGKLPAFSYLEPRWIAPQGTTSYHPGGDLVPGEQHLLEIFNALQDSPAWDETLFVITFDEHGGIYDHVPPPYAVKPYPNDWADGFNFDLMGVRIPTLLISPWINEKTVFRSETDVAYESTSILATILDWLGIPRSRWGLGDRIKVAPTFEGVLNRTSPRTDVVKIEPPYDPDNPRDGAANGDIPLNGLQEVMGPRLIATITRHLPRTQARQIAANIMAKGTTLKSFCEQIEALEKRLNR